MGDGEEGERRRMRMREGTRRKGRVSANGGLTLHSL